MLIPVSIIIPYFLQSSLPDGGGEGTQVQVQGQYGCILPPLPSPGWWEVVRRSQLAETRGPGDSQSKCWLLVTIPLSCCRVDCCIPTCPTLPPHLGTRRSPMFDWLEMQAGRPVNSIALFVGS